MKQSIQIWKLSSIWKKAWFIAILFGLSKMLFAQPLDYYNGTENLSGEELKTALHNIIKGHVDFSYSRIRYIINYSDADPDNPDNVILFYTQESRDANKYGSGGDYINREHVWAKSHGFFEDIRTMNGDAFNLRPADASVNEDRSNLDFDDVQPNGTQHPEATDCWYSSSAWEPGPLTKGQVARILFYMATRYENEGDEIDLELVDQLNNYPQPVFGKLSTLLKWNNDYPPSDFERRRNERLFRIQQNRNPFVDYPGFANLIWNNETPGNLAIGELSMQPEKPLPGDEITIGCRVSSESATDSVLLYWGTAFNSTPNRIAMSASNDFYSCQFPLNNVVAGDMVYFKLIAHSGTDSCIAHGTHLVPEQTLPENITPIKSVQGTGDVSPMLNQTVTISGRITANFDYSFYVQDENSKRSGVNVYNTLLTGNVGDSVVIRGKVGEYSTLTEMLDVEYFYNFGNKSEVKPLVITCSQIGEDYEGMLVQLNNVTFVDEGLTIPNENKSYTFTDETGQSVLFSGVNYRTAGKQLPYNENSIVGIVSQYNGNYQLLARDINDLSVPTSVTGINIAKETVTVYPNPVRDLLHFETDLALKNIEIFSASGSLMIKKSSFAKSLNVEGLTPGIYLVRMETVNGQPLFSKFNKQ